MRSLLLLCFFTILCHSASGRYNKPRSTGSPPKYGGGRPSPQRNRAANRVAAVAAKGSRSVYPGKRLTTARGAGKRYRDPSLVASPTPPNCKKRDRPMFVIEDPVTYCKGAPMPQPPAINPWGTRLTFWTVQKLSYADVSGNPENGTSSVLCIKNDVQYFRLFHPTGAQYFVSGAKKHYVMSGAMTGAEFWTFQVYPQDYNNMLIACNTASAKQRALTFGSKRPRRAMAASSGRNKRFDKNELLKRIEKNEDDWFPQPEGGGFWRFEWWQDTEPYLVFRGIQDIWIPQSAAQIFYEYYLDPPKNALILQGEYVKQQELKMQKKPKKQPGYKKQQEPKKQKPIH